MRIVSAVEKATFRCGWQRDDSDDVNKVPTCAHKYTSVPTCHSSKLSYTDAYEFGGIIVCVSAKITFRYTNKDNCATGQTCCVICIYFVSS